MRRSIIVERKTLEKWGRERVSLIKSLISQDRKDALESKDRAENVS